MAISRGDIIPPPKFKYMPNELKQCSQWLLWKAEPINNKLGNLTKVPVTLEGIKFSGWNNTNKLYSFETVVKAFQTGKFTGVGFVLVGTDYICIDLDNDVSTKNISNKLGELINHGYTEISPSGKGYHIWIKGKKPTGMGKIGHTALGEKLEVFGDTGWVTMTGNSLYPAPIVENQDLILRLYNRYFKEKQEIGRNTKPTIKPTAIPDLEKIKKKMFNGRNGQKICLLWNGDTSMYESPSEAELALCWYIAFYSNGDHYTVDKLFRQSGLYRSKWDERRSNTTYGGMTIEKAINSLNRKGYKVYNKKTTQHMDDAKLTVEDRTGEVLSNTVEKQDNLQTELFRSLDNKLNEMTERMNTLEEINRTLLERLEQQEHFKRELENRLEQQLNYIEERLDKRDRVLMESIRESQEAKKQVLMQIAAMQEEKKKGFFTRMFSN